MQMTIKKLDVFSVCRVFGVIQAGVGLITGLFFSLAFLMDPEFLKASVGGVGSLFGVWSFAVLPFLNAILGVLSGALIAWIYNTAVRLCGIGILLEVETCNDVQE